MAVDWGLAGQIAGFGFGLVFLVLIIVAVAMWLTGLVISKTSTGEDETTDSQKGA